jgi:endo-1,4-beta-xylanase
MKPDSFVPGSRPATWFYTWTNADSIVNAAELAGFKIHGHTLIWHSPQSPAWLAEGGEENLNKFVTDVVTRYKDKILSWDVVNEAFRDNITAANVAGDNWKNCLRQTDAPWYQSVGDSYIEKAFLKARAADPNARLYYNDYALNSFSGNNKQRAVYNMVKDINARYPNVGGRPLIDGIGMQSHHHLNTTPESVEASIILFTSLDVEIGITELDIQAAGPQWGDWGDGNAQRQAAKYAAFFRIFINHASDITRVTFWGLDDGKSWRSSSYPTLLDRNYNSKPSFEAVRNPSRY